MRKTVFVHIGAPEAGAALIHQQLNAHRAALLSAGTEVLDLRDHAARPSFERVVARVLASEQPRIVVSDPRLASAPADGVRAGLTELADHHVQVVYAVPDFGEALIAAWQRDVLDGSRPVTLADWIEGLAGGEREEFWSSHDLGDVFATWSVLRHDVHAVIAPSRAGASDALWERFASVIGAPTEIVPSLGEGERRLGLDEIDLLRRVRERWDGEDPEVGKASIALLVRALIERGTAPRQVLLPAEHRTWVEKQASSQIDFLVSSGVQVVGDPAELELAGERFAVDVTPDEPDVLARGVDAIAALMGQLVVSHRDEGASSNAPQSPARPTRSLTARVRRLVTDPGAAEYAIRRRVRARFPSRGRRIYYLHIGAPKSGSSYLQSLLWRNRRALMRDGIYLPGRSQTDHFLAATDFRERSYATQESEARWRGAWDRLIDDAERSGCRRIIITSEFFSTAGAEKIATKLERLADAEVHVIYAVRDFPGLLASEWQQGVKTAALPTWHEWLADTERHGVTGGLWRRHHVGGVCHRWSTDAVDQMHILLVPRSGGPPDELWRRFQSIVGWKVHTRTDAPKANESLGYAQAELLRRVQHQLVNVEPSHVRARLTKDLLADRFLARMNRVDTPLIPNNLRAWVEAESEKRRQQVVDSGAAVVGDLDDLQVSESKFSSIPTDPSDALMLDTAVSVIARLTHRLATDEAARS